MAGTRDIVATYRGPGRVMRRMLSMGQREDRAIAIVMAGCAVIFAAQLPRLAREAYLTGQELNPMLGASLLAWVFIAPLLLYVLAAVSHMIARIFGGRGSWFDARLALFWAVLASSPLMLLNGLVAGFIGPSAALSFVGLLWIGVFCWFWARCLWVAERPQNSEEAGA
jgi:hypothetical protein